MLNVVLARHERNDVFTVRTEPRAPDLPDVPVNWREEAREDDVVPLPTNHARRERRAETKYPTFDDLTFGSHAEIEVYKLLLKLQRDGHTTKTIAITLYLR